MNNVTEILGALGGAAPQAGPEKLAAMAQRAITALGKLGVNSLSFSNIPEGDDRAERLKAAFAKCNGEKPQLFFGASAPKNELVEGKAATAEDIRTHLNAPPPPNNALAHALQRALEGN